MKRNSNVLGGLKYLADSEVLNLSTKSQLNGWSTLLKAISAMVRINTFLLLSKLASTTGGKEG
jgi:hypothetical protein